MTIQCGRYHSSNNQTKLVFTMQYDLFGNDGCDDHGGGDFLNFCPPVDKWPPFGQEDRTLQECIMLSFPFLPFLNVQKIFHN